jgi:hypothetical protein
VSERLTAQQADPGQLTLAKGEIDLRGHSVRDAGGETMGQVDALYVDPVERRVRFIVVRAGGLLGIGGRQYLIPVELIDTIVAQDIRLNERREDAERQPEHEPQRAPDEGYWRTIYDAHRLTPYWSEWDEAAPPRRY